MLDVSKLVTNPQRYANDPDGVMAELDHWSPVVANRRADEEGLTLGEEHWQHLYWLRERYRMFSARWTARDLTRQLGRDFAGIGGLRHLYTLFPQGPVAQGCRLAGLPVPRDALDPSFGSVH